MASSAGQTEQLHAVPKPTYSGYYLVTHTYLKKAIYHNNNWEHKHISPVLLHTFSFGNNI